MSSSTSPTTTEHVHKWHLKLHLDGCHSYESHYECWCGATRYTWEERKLKPPHFSMMAYPEACERCRELIKGARRKNRRDEIHEAPAPSAA